MSENMTKRVALVTGASSGIGREIAGLLIEKGIDVYGVGRTFAAEDFAFYTKHIKGAHIKIGTDTSFPLHNPQFDIDDKAIKNAFKIFKELCI